MSYIEGFVIPVPTAKREEFHANAVQSAAIFQRLGATRIVECWGNDIPDGKVTDFKRAVQATAEENVVFSWIVWPSKAVRDDANAKMMDDPEMREMGMPFDGKRMIFGGFDIMVDTGADR